MKTKFTPGPWFRDGEFIRSVEDSGLIASVYISPNLNDGRNQSIQANAALIAAAPDMFDALENMLEALGLLRQNGVNVLAVPQAVKARELAHKAIKKARGE